MAEPSSPAAPPSGAKPKPMRVLMINTEPGWRGGENQLLLLVAGLAGQGVASVTACRSGGELERRLLLNGAITASMHGRGGFGLRGVMKLRKLLRPPGFDLVHAHTSHAHSLALWALLGRRVPLLVTRRVDFAIGRGPFGGLQRWKYRQPARLIAVSDCVKRVLVDGGTPAERVSVIRDGVDPARLAGGEDGAKALRAEFGIPGDAVVFGITAHLTDHKDHRTLLRAFAIVEGKMPKAWLLIAGGGELETELRLLASELGLQRTRFLGFRTDIATVLAALDVFVLSSHHEGLGSAVMDAMFRALAVVATTAGGIPELVTPGHDGLLVPPRDPVALAGALTVVGLDPAERARLGDHARATAAARFDAARMVAEHVALYREVLERERAGAGAAVAAGASA
jgi:glycosyltransferase involved in cell wall biosynthesis